MSASSSSNHSHQKENKEIIKENEEIVKVIQNAFIALNEYNTVLTNEKYPSERKLEKKLDFHNAIKAVTELSAPRMKDILTLGILIGERKNIIPGTLFAPEFLPLLLEERETYPLSYLNIRDRRGRTLLMEAVKGLNIEAARLLIELGANSNIRFIFSHSRYQEVLDGIDNWRMPMFSYPDIPFGTPLHLVIHNIIDQLIRVKSVVLFPDLLELARLLIEEGKANVNLEGEGFVKPLTFLLNSLSFSNTKGEIDIDSIKPFIDLLIKNGAKADCYAEIDCADSTDNLDFNFFANVNSLYRGDDYNEPSSFSVESEKKSNKKKYTLTSIEHNNKIKIDFSPDNQTAGALFTTVRSPRIFTFLINYYQFNNISLDLSVVLPDGQNLMDIFLKGMLHSTDAVKALGLLLNEGILPTPIPKPIYCCRPADEMFNIIKNQANPYDFSVLAYIQKLQELFPEYSYRHNDPAVKAFVTFMTHFHYEYAIFYDRFIEISIAIQKAIPSLPKDILQLIAEYKGDHNDSANVVEDKIKPLNLKRLNLFDADPAQKAVDKLKELRNYSSQKRKM